MAKFWEENKIFSTKVDKNKKKFYCLEMFHTIWKNSYGSCKKLCIGDVLARYKLLQGFNVLHPMGWIHLACLQKMLQNKIILTQKHGPKQTYLK